MMGLHVLLWCSETTNAHGKLPSNFSDSALYSAGAWAVFINTRGPVSEAPPAIGYSYTIRVTRANRVRGPRDRQMTQMTYHHPTCIPVDHPDQNHHHQVPQPASPPLVDDTAVSVRNYLCTVQTTVFNQKSLKTKSSTLYIHTYICPTKSISRLS